MKEPLERQQFKLLPPSERKYVELSFGKSEEYNPNTVLQYNNRIKYRAINAIKEIAWLCDNLPKDQLKKIFSDDRIEELFKINKKALEVTARNPVDFPFELKKYAYYQGLYLFKCIMSEPRYQLVNKFISDPDHYNKLELEFQGLQIQVDNFTERIAVAEEMLKNCGLTKDDMDKEVYTQHNAKIIKNLENQVAEGKLTSEQIQDSIEHLKLSWEDYKKRSLDVANWMKEHKIDV